MGRKVPVYRVGEDGSLTLEKEVDEEYAKWLVGEDDVANVERIIVIYEDVEGSGVEARVHEYDEESVKE